METKICTCYGASGFKFIGTKNGQQVWLHIICGGIRITDMVQSKPKPKGDDSK